LEGFDKRKTGKFATPRRKANLKRQPEDDSQSSEKMDDEEEIPGGETKK